MNTAGTPNAVYVQGRYAYIDENSAIQVVDVHDPTNPTSVGDFSAGSSNPTSLVVSGRYLFNANSSSNLLQIFDMGGTYDQQLEAGGIETGTLSVDTNATVNGDESISGGLGVGQSLEVEGNLSTAGYFLQQNSTNSTTAFQVQNSSSVSDLTVDTTDNLVLIGSNNTSNTNQILLQTNSFNTFADTANCSSSTNQGAMYYNTATDSVRACVNGTWQDLVTTADLGILTFGIVPDASNGGSTAGDVGGVTGNVNSPCKVTWSGAQQVTVAGCAAYSGGRKVLVSSTNLSTSAIGANTYVNVCLTGGDDQPAVVGSGSTAETSAGLPSFSVTAPVVCLATIETNSTAGNVGNIWDTRTFTNTNKIFATINSVNSPGWLVVGSNTSFTSVTTNSTGAGPIMGVVIATTGTASSNTINAILAVQGQQFVKIPASGSGAVNTSVETSGNTGYAQTASNTTSATNYAWAGILENTVDTTCSASTNCQFSGLIDLDISR